MITRMKPRMRASLAAACLAFGMGTASLGPRAASAQEEGTSAEDPAASRSVAFRAVEGAPEESVPGGPLTVAAYAVTWLLVLLFLWRLGRLHAAARRDLDRLTRLLESRSDKNS